LPHHAAGFRSPSAPRPAMSMEVSLLSFACAVVWLAHRIPGTLHISCSTHTAHLTQRSGRRAHRLGRQRRQQAARGGRAARGRRRPLRRRRAQRQAACGCQAPGGRQAARPGWPRGGRDAAAVRDALRACCEGAVRTVAGCRSGGQPAGLGVSVQAGCALVAMRPWLTCVAVQRGDGAAAAAAAAARAECDGAPPLGREDALLTRTSCAQPHAAYHICPDRKGSSLSVMMREL